MAPALVNLTSLQGVSIFAGNITSPEIPHASKAEIEVEAVLLPDSPADEPLFNHGHSQWKLRITLRLAGSSLDDSPFVFYRSPHDLWRHVRSSYARPGFLLESWNKSQPEPVALLRDAHYCSTGPGDPFLMQIGDKAGRPTRVVKAVDKYCGFHFSLFATADQIFLECRKGSVSNLETLIGAEISNFEDGIVFELSLDMLLKLPAYSSHSDKPRDWQLVVH